MDKLNCNFEYNFKKKNHLKTQTFTQIGCCLALGISQPLAKLFITYE